MAGDSQGAIDFYFDFSSPYGYFAAARIDALAAKYGRTVNWHPLLLGVVFKITGGQPLPMVPLKGDYVYRDFERCARFYNIPYARPDVFPIPTQLAARAMLWVQEHLGAEKGVQFAKAVYAAYFVDGKTITEAEVLIPLATRLGIDGAAMIDGANSEPVKAKMKVAMEEAVERKVFGSPFVIADGEPFWGVDRFDQLEHFLKHGKL
ncbi:2-hydroxychromene-2-carboxylate isomerase [Oxalobacteraceae bacterium OM1]|nr:2-hydroxychromene-2-carboxylate isomerase [Oxalobacteraceae bacterium OM1]